MSADSSRPLHCASLTGWLIAIKCFSVRSVLLWPRLVLEFHFIRRRIAAKSHCKIITIVFRSAEPAEDEATQQTPERSHQPGAFRMIVVHSRDSVQVLVLQALPEFQQWNVNSVRICETVDSSLLDPLSVAVHSVRFLPVYLPGCRICADRRFRLASSILYH